MLAVLLRVFITLITASTVVTSIKLCECYHKCCGRYCGKVLVCLMLLLTVCSASNSNKHRRDTRTCNRGCKCNRGSIWPREPYYLEGEDLVLICNRRKGPYKHLTFLRGQNSSEVPAQYIQRHNDTAIKMVIPNITGEHIDATGPYSTQYRCVHKNLTKDRCYDSVSVRLEYAVRKPVNLACWDYNFNEMTCNWSLAVEYHNRRDINITCEYKNSSTTSVKFNTDGSWESCPNMTKNSCHWDSLRYPAPSTSFGVKVTVTNIERGYSEIIYRPFDKYDIVEPGPVTNLKGFQKRSQNRCIELDWEPPSQRRCFVFIVTYNSTCSSEQEKEFFYFGRKKKFNDSVIICDLVPYTLYTFSVKGRAIRADDNGTYFQRGYWSKSKILEMKINKDELDVNPVTLPGLYELSNDSRHLPEDHDSLNQYWTPLKDCDLHDAPYNVSYSITVYNRTTSVSHSAFTAQIDVLRSRVLNVTLQAANSVGSPHSHIDMTIFPAMFGPCPSELIVQYNKTNKDCETSAVIVVRENRYNFTDLFHTLVWCKGTHDCEEPVKWKKLETNVTSFWLPGNLCDVDYRYGLVTYGYHEGQGLIVDTGIHWEPCIYQLGKEIDKPLDNIRVGETQEGKGFMVEWSQYDCKVMEAYVTHYIVIYCVTDEESDCSCKDKQHVNVSRQQNSYTSNEMSPGSHICVWVRGVSNMGVGPTNEKAETLTIGKSNSIVVLVSVVCSITFAALVVVFCYPVRKCYKWIKKITNESRNISVPAYSPESEGNHDGLHDQYDRLLYNETSGIDTGSGIVLYNYSSAGTTVTGVLYTSEGQPLTCYDCDSSGELDGYKQPIDFEAVESGYQDETISKHSSNNSMEVRSEDLKESRKTIDEQKLAESQENVDMEDSCFIKMKVEPNENGGSANSQSEAHLDQVNECEEDLQCSNDVINTTVNDLVESKHEENFELKTMTFQGDNHFLSANILESQELVEETDLTFDQFINQIETNDVLYKETNSGSTFFDDSDDLQGEIEEFSDTDEADKISMSENDRSNLQDHMESLGGNVDISDHSDDKSGNVSPSGQTSVIQKSAIKNKLTADRELLEQDNSEDDVKALNDSKSDLSYLSEKDIAEISDDDTSDIETTNIIVNQSDGSGIGYKRSEDVSGMSESDDDSEEVSDESAEQNGRSLAVEPYGQHGIDTEKVENKNHVVNGLIHKNGFISSVADKLRNRISSGSDSSIEHQPTSHGNSGSSSGVKSYVIADKELNLQEVDRKHGNNSEGFKAGEKYKNSPYQNGKKIPGIAEDRQSYSHS